jgi:hypothetical protein
MTGQVKEEVLTRWGELGVRVDDGTIEFDPVLLRRREFLTKQTNWSYYDVAAQEQTLTVPPDALAFTYCQVPITYRLVDGAGSVNVRWADGSVSTFSTLRLDKKTSAAVFERGHEVREIEVLLPESAITRT